MKKLSNLLAIAVISLASFAVSTTAFAQAGTCEIGYTGPNSENKCTITTTQTCEISNENTVTVGNDNTQIAVSGDAESEGNTDGDNVQTGSATNSNGTTIDVVVENGTTCTVVTTVPATPTPPVTPAPVTPSSGGSGAVKQPVPAPQKAAAAVLPNTSGDATTGYIIGLVSVLGAAAIISRIAVLAYSRTRL